MKKGAGFTIVELLVVIVVIGVLAAISIVAYTGITDKANDAVLSSDLANISKQLELYKLEKGAYPTGNNCPNPGASEICLKASSGVALSYRNPSSTRYNIDATKDGLTKNRNESSIAQTGSSFDVLKNGLIVHLDSSNALSYVSGSVVWNDLSGNNNNATLSNVAYDSNSSSLTFNGSSSFGQINSNALLDGIKNNLTMCAKIQTSYPGSGWVIAKNTSLATDMQYGFFTGVSNLYSYIGPTNVGGGAISSDGSFNNVCMTLSLDNINNKFNINFYIKKDGILNKISSIQPTNTITNTQPIFIGKRNGGVYFKGNIQKIFLFNRALSEYEVALLNTF